MQVVSLNLELTQKLGTDFCIRNRCFAAAFEKDVLSVAVENYDELLLEVLNLRSSQAVEIIEVGASIIENEIKRLSNQKSGAGIFSDLIKSEIAVDDEFSIEELMEKSQSQPVVKLTNDILNQAIAEGATDIHIEPYENAVKVRYRKDGMLKDSLDMPKWIQAPLTSRLKILAELDIAEKRLPHDGRIKWVISGNVIDLRVSTLPTRLGEKVVLRILKHSAMVSNLNSLGLSSDLMASIQQIIQKPQGMLFVTGPTGSGKTSTLYAALREIIDKDINISTIEDPVEYRMEGANQVQVNEKAGLTFSSALRSLLRQDPDVLLVGEIRDEETAAIAVQAAQTGHLVFSTLHTNDSVSAITRLRDLKIKPFLIASAVLGILAQRLVRIVCPQCVEMQISTPEMKLAIPGLPDEVPKAVGCQACGQTGYSGRTGLFELLVVNEAVKEAILDEKGEIEIKKLAGVKPLILHGVENIKNNITTPEELIRIASAE